MREAGAALDVEVRVLGPVEVDRGDGTVERVHGLGARLLLALIADRGRSVDDDSLVERLWPEAPPRHAMASVRNVVARLRRTFGPAVVGRDLAGYRVDPQAPRLDLDRFRATVAAARLDGTDAARAAEQVDGALQLVRGRPLHEVADDVWAMPAAAAIAEQVAVAEELWASLALVADAADVDVSRLRAAATAHPHREVRWRHLVAALTAAGHRTEALRAAGEARRALAEFGMVPDRGLLDLERQLLGVDAAAVPSSSRVMARRDPMVGRDAALADVLRTGHVVWIEGEPGTGKTRLLAEVADRTACDRTALLYVACPRAPGALGVVPALLAAADDLVPASRRPGLDPGDAHQEPEVRRAALGGDIVARLRAATCEREVVVAVDDVQWADPSDTAVLHDVVVRTLDVVHWIVASRPVTRHAAAATLRGDLERAAAVRAVALGNLAPADVAELISDVATELDPPARAALAAEVCASTDGHPLSVAESIAHRDRLTDAERMPRLDAIVAGTLARLDARDRRLVDVLAVAGGPCPVTVLAGACDCPAAEVLERVDRLVDEGLLGAPADGAVDLHHDLVRRAVERHLPGASALAARRALVQELSRDPRSVVAYAEQLLQGGAFLDDHGHDRDRAVGAAIERLLDGADYVAAARLAERYLALGDVPDAGCDALAAQLKAATALIAVGDVGPGRAVLVRLREPARSSGDLGVFADTILAMGPLMTGGREEDAVLADAEHLVGALPAADGYRRVQLACWAAHQRLLRGDRLLADHLLDIADADPWGAGTLQGLVLAIRAQADTLVGSSPAAARRSLDELRRHAARSHDITADAAALLLGARQAWAEGTLADVAAARDGITAIGARLPRPDIRWWPAALEASIELAAGRLDTAETAIETAARIGRELRVVAAAPTARAQQLTMLYLGGTLGTAAEALAQFAAAPDATVGIVAGYGLACAEAGDVDGVAFVAGRLAAEPQLLVQAGASWPLTAMCAGEVAVAAGHRPLARSVRASLERFGGTGLALHSVGYFGVADRVLGKLAVLLGEGEHGVALLEAAVDQERRRGAAGWERRAVADLWAACRSVTAANLRS